MVTPLRFLRFHHRRLFSTSLNPNPNPSPTTFEAPLSHLINSIRKVKDPDALLSAFNLASEDPRFRHSFAVYDLAVRRLSALSRPDAVVSLLDHQKLHPDFSQNEHFAARIILLYGRARLLDHALSTFHSLPFPPTAISFNALLTSFARAGQPSASLANLLQEIQSSFPSIKPTVVSYNIILSALCDRSEFGLAAEVVQLMEKIGISPNLVTFNTLLNSYYRKRRFEDAERIWREMGEKDVWSYNSKLRGLVYEKRVDDAVELFDEMKRVGLEPDVHSLNALIRGYCESGKLEEAKKLYLGFEENNWVPNLGTFKLLIPAFLKVKEFDFVVRLCNESLNYRCYLSVEMLQEVVDALLEEELYDKAKKLLKHVRSKAFYGKKCLKVPLSCLAA